MTAEQFDVVIVGAGFGGIGAAIQLKRLGFDNFVILDREDDLGGTWHVNHYPGLAVDVPTTTYSYFFEPNPNWSRLFAPGPEIKQYADDVADKYDVRRHMRFNVTVESARWDEDAQLWQRHAGRRRDPDRPLPDHRDRLPVAAAHARTSRASPTSPARSSTPPSGTTTTTRPDSRIAIIGTGATAVQLIPELAKTAADLTVYQRTPIWVVPKIDLRFSRAGEAAVRPGAADAARHPAVTDAIYEFMIVPRCCTTGRLTRLNVGAADLAQDAPLRVDPGQGAARQADAGLRLRLQAADVLQRLLPRASPSRTCTCRADGIERIESDGIVNADGTKTEIDTLVLATGFDLWEANFPAFEIVGREGRNLGKWWRDNRFQAYQGVTDAVLPELPEPGQPVCVPRVELLQHDGIPDAAHGSTVRRAQAPRGNHVRGDRGRQHAVPGPDDRDCSAIRCSAIGNCATSRSYYFNPSGEATLLRPMSMRTAIREASNFPLSDYQISLRGNSFHVFFEA